MMSLCTGAGRDAQWLHHLLRGHLQGEPKVGGGHRQQAQEERLAVELGGVPLAVATVGPQVAEGSQGVPQA